MNTNHEKQLAVIVGYGAGLGEAIKQSFEREGYMVITINRSDGMIIADTTAPNEVQRAFAKVGSLYGTPDVVICNTAMLTIENFFSTTATRFEETWRASVMSTFNVAQACIPSMIQAGGGTFLVTGATASIRGASNFSAFSSAKFALRGLTQSLAREFQPQKIHVAHIVIDGIIWSPQSRERFPGLREETVINSHDAASTYIYLAKQPESAWTHEIDIRPYSETF